MSGVYPLPSLYPGDVYPDDGLGLGAVPFAQELYERTLPLAVRDKDNGGAWATYVTAIGVMFDRFEFVRDTPQTVGYGSLLDVDRAAVESLGWLGMFSGVVTNTALPDGDQREQVDATEGFHRGTLDAITRAAQRHLTGSRRVTIFERNGGDAYAVRVITYSSETPDPVQTVRDIVAAKPVGLIFTIDLLPGWIIQEMEAYYAARPAGAQQTIAGGPETDYTKLTDLEARI